VLFAVCVYSAIMTGSRNWKRKNWHWKRWIRKIRHISSLIG